MKEQVTAEFLKVLSGIVGDIPILDERLTAYAVSIRDVVSQIHKLHEAPLAGIEPITVMDVPARRR